MTHDGSYTFSLQSCIAFDLEVYPGRWCVGFLGPGSDGARTTRVVDGSRGELAKLLEWFGSKGRILVGYNSSKFDVPLIRGILKGIDPYAPAQAIVREDRTPLALTDLPDLPCDHIDLAARLRRGGGFPSLKLVARGLAGPPSGICLIRPTRCWPMSNGRK
jgi:hypothetical protein